MIDIVTLWHGEHGKFTRLLDQLEDRMARFAAGDDTQIDILAAIVAYLHHYGKQAHHRREDIGFAHLARIDPTFEPMAADLQREHEAIVATGQSLVEALDGLASGGIIVARDVLIASIRSYLDLQRSHLAREDHDVIPRIAGRFGARDWQLVRQRINDEVDVRLPPELLPRFRQLSQQIAVELAAN